MPHAVSTWTRSACAAALLAGLVRTSAAADPSAMTEYRAQTMRVRSTAIAALDALWRQQPVHATAAGVHRYDATLATFTPAARAAQLATITALMEKARAVNPAVLTADDRTDRAAILAALTERQLQLTDMRVWERDPLVYAEECVRGVLSLTTRNATPAKKRWDALRARLVEIPRVLREMQSNLRNPDPAMASAAADALDAVAAILPQTVADAATQAGKKSARDAQPAVQEALAALQAAGTGLRASAAHDARSAGVGPDAFDRFIRTVLAVECSADSLLRLADAHIRAPGDDGGWIDAAPRAPASFGRSSILAAYRAAIEAAATTTSSTRAATVPRWIGDVVLAETPACLLPFEPDVHLAPVAAFDQPNPGEHGVTADRWRAVTSATLYVPPIPSSLPDEDRARWFDAVQSGSLASAALTYCIPGTHLQASIAAQSIDPVRKATHALTSVEGWAAYCEDLALARGLATEPGARGALATAGRRRAARATGEVHVQRGDWTIDEAARFVARTTGESFETARRTVVADAHTPGRAVAALVGREQILQMRARYRAAHRTDYSLRAFHDRFLDAGMVPVAFVAELVAPSRADAPQLEGELPVPRGR